MNAPTRRLAALVVTLPVAIAALGAGVVSAATRFLTVPLADDGPYVLAIIGSDTGPPRSGSPTGPDARADALHLLVVSPDRQHVAVLNFPRDSWVDVAGRGRAKINDALDAGPENVVATLESLSGLDVDDWILTDMHGLVIAVDEYGGVEVAVEQRLYDPVGASSDLYPGPQRLRGLDALAFTRDRKSRSDGDLGRSWAQTALLQAWHDQIRKEDPDLARISAILKLIRRTTVSSISADRMLQLAFVALAIDPANVQNIKLPGQIGTAGSASVIYLTDDAHAIMADVAADGYYGPPPGGSP